MAEQKTNAMRILDQKNIRYEVITYDVGDFKDSILAAEKAGIPLDKEYKTLIAQGKSERYSVFVVPAASEMDMKKAARAVDEKSVSLIPVKDINRITGYVRGGCSPLGIKRQCRIVIDESAKHHNLVYISGGKLGCTISLSPLDLADAADAVFGDITLVYQNDDPQIVTSRHNHDIDNRSDPDNSNGPTVLADVWNTDVRIAHY